MEPKHPLWHAVMWPSVVLLVGLVGVVTAVVLDEVFSSEMSLTIGAPSLIVLAVGAVGLVVAIVVYVVRNRRAG